MTKYTLGTFTQGTKNKQNLNSREASGMSRLKVTQYNFS